MPGYDDYLGGYEDLVAPHEALGCAAWAAARGAGQRPGQGPGPGDLARFKPPPPPPPPPTSRRLHTGRLHTHHPSQLDPRARNPPDMRSAVTSATCACRYQPQAAGRRRTPVRLMVTQLQQPPHPLATSLRHSIWTLCQRPRWGQCLGPAKWGLRRRRRVCPLAAPLIGASATGGDTAKWVASELRSAHSACLHFAPTSPPAATLASRDGPTQRSK
jgi:hypothetical protein